MSQTRARSRAVEIAVVIMVLVVSASLARNFLRPAPPPEPDNLAVLKADLQDALGRYSDVADFDVGVTPVGPNEADVKVNLRVMPADRPIRKQWAPQFVLFVCARHPAVRIKGLRVTDTQSGQDVSELRPPPGSFESLEYFEQARSEVLRRTGQSQLDSALGANASLLLVDASAAQLQARPRRTRRRAAVSPHSDAPHGLALEARVKESDAPRHAFSITKVEAYLIVNGTANSELSSTKLGDTLKSSLGLNTLKVVYLPALKESH